MIRMGITCLKLCMTAVLASMIFSVVGCIPLVSVMCWTKRTVDLKCYLTKLFDSQVVTHCMSVFYRSDIIHITSWLPSILG